MDEFWTETTEGLGVPGEVSPQAQVQAEERQRRFAALEAVGGAALVTRAEWDAVIGALREARAFALTFTEKEWWKEAWGAEARVLEDKIARVLEVVGERVSLESLE